MDTSLFYAKAGKWAIIIAFVLVPALSFAQVPITSSPEKIESFFTEGQINSDGSVILVEHIRYDFGAAQRHGIYRELEDTFTDTEGSSHKLTFYLKSVTDENGTPYETDISTSGHLFRIRIGNADTLVSGKHEYVITYSVSNAISFSKDQDEFYFNVTGNRWTVPIEEVRAQIIFPSGAEREKSQVHCYSGIKGSKESCTAELSNDAGIKGSFRSTRALAPGEGITVALGFQKGLLTPPHAWAGPFAPYLPYLPPLVVALVAAFIGYLIWNKDGKDPKAGTVVAEYEPPQGLTFIESAYLYTPSGREKGFVASAIIHLAVAGYLRIEPTEEKQFLVFNKKGYRLMRLVEPSTIQDPLDKSFIEFLFESEDSEKAALLSEVLVSDLSPKHFLLSLKDLREYAAESLLKKGFYANNFSSANNTLYVYAGLAVAFAFGAYFFELPFPFEYAFIGFITGALIFAFFGYLMPKKTAQGRDALRALQGLKLYVSVAEKDRLEFHNAPQKTPQLFEKLLPYAMLFGVTAIWTKEFEGIMKEPPSWYGGTNSAWNAAAFAGSMSNLNSSVASASTVSSASSGGGFSGGGAVGGGGGSW